MTIKHKFGKVLYKTKPIFVFHDLLSTLVHFNELNMLYLIECFSVNSADTSTYLTQLIKMKIKALEKSFQYRKLLGK